MGDTVHEFQLHNHLLFDINGRDGALSENTEMNWLNKDPLCEDRKEIFICFSFVFNSNMTGLAQVHRKLA